MRLPPPPPCPQTRHSSTHRPAPTLMHTQVSPTKPTTPLAADPLALHRTSQPPPPPPKRGTGGCPTRMPAYSNTGGRQAGRQHSAHKHTPTAGRLPPNRRPTMRWPDPPMHRPQAPTTDYPRAHRAQKWRKKHKAQINAPQMPATATTNIPTSTKGHHHNRLTHRCRHAPHAPVQSLDRLTLRKNALPQHQQQHTSLPFACSANATGRPTPKRTRHRP